MDGRYNSCQCVPVPAVIIRGVEEEEEEEEDCLCVSPLYGEYLVTDNGAFT